MGELYESSPLGKEIFNKDDTVREDFLRAVKQTGAADAIVQNFKVVVCGDTGEAYQAMRNRVEASHVVSDPDAFIAAQRNNPLADKGYTAVLKALGQPATCDEVPMSALPTPAVAALPEQGRSRG